MGFQRLKLCNDVGYWGRRIDYGRHTEGNKKWFLFWTSVRLDFGLGFGLWVRLDFRSGVRSGIWAGLIFLPCSPALRICFRSGDHKYR